MTSPELAASAENSLAGALLLEPAGVMEAVAGAVSHSDFFYENPKAIFRAVQDLVSHGQPADATLILNRAKAFCPTLSYQFCADAMKVVPTLVNAAEYARLIHQYAIERKSEAIGLALSSGELDTMTAMSRLQDLLQAGRASVADPEDDWQSFMDEIDLAMREGSNNRFVPTGFYNLDGVLSGGLVNGGLITVAARPGTGKSTAAINIAENIAADGKSVLYFSFEMTKLQIQTCRIAAYKGFNRADVYSAAAFREDKAIGRTREKAEQNMKDLQDAISVLYHRPFRIVETAATVDDIERQARCMKDLGLLVIDHIGLIRTEGSASRYDQVTQITHRLKQLAMGLKIPILALCQLNRESTRTKSQRPTMANLRDSGSIEEDSDVVILLHRPQDDPTRIQFIVDKNRHGRTATLDFKFIGEFSRITL